MDRQYCMYLEDAEKQKMIDDYRLEVASKKLDLMLESLDRRIAIQLKEAEVKVLSEGGTYSDLDYLYNAIYTEAEIAKEKMGIGERLMYLINKIMEGLRGLFTGKNAVVNPETTYVVDSDYKNRMTLIGKIKSGVETAIKYIKEGCSAFISFIGGNAQSLLFGLFGGAIGAKISKFLFDDDDESDNNNDESVTTEAADDSDTITGEELAADLGTAAGAMAAIANLQELINSLESQLAEQGKEVGKAQERDEKYKESRMNGSAEKKIQEKEEKLDELNKEKATHQTSTGKTKRGAAHQKRIDELNKQIGELKKSLNGSKTAWNQAKKQNAENEALITEKYNEYLRIKGQISMAEEELRKKQEQLKKIQEKYADNSTGENDVPQSSDNKPAENKPEETNEKTPKNSNQNDEKQMKTKKGKYTLIIKLGNKEEKVDEEQASGLKKALNKLKEWLRAVINWFNNFRKKMTKIANKKRTKKLEKLQNKINKANEKMNNKNKTSNNENEKPDETSDESDNTSEETSEEESK